MKRKLFFNDRINIKRFKLGKCQYCNSNIFIFMGITSERKIIRLSCDHYSHYNCISRFLRTNTKCHKCQKKDNIINLLSEMKLR